MIDKKQYDLIIIGSGAAGMTTAAVAANEGLDVIVIEKTELIGGNTSFSGGMVYVPNNSAMEAAGVADDPEMALRYLDATVPTEDGRDMRKQFIEKGREAIDYLNEHTSVKLKPVPFYPDYYPDEEGSRERARVLEPYAFDARGLGKWFPKLRPPIPEFMLFGGMMVAREDLSSFRKVWKSVPAFVRVAQLTLQFVWQRLSHHRGTRLVLGNALSGRLLKSLIDLDVPILIESNTQGLIKKDGRISGIEVNTPGGPMILEARVGVVLATGGFSQSQEKRKKYLPLEASKHSAFAPGSTGDGLDLGETAGGVINDQNTHNAYWSPTSVYERADGRTVVYPHTVTDRGKPGSIVVNKAGRRFTNEAVSYHQFGEAMYAANKDSPSIPAYLICDNEFLWKYGLGAIIPFTQNLKPYQKANYLKTAPTLEALADLLGVYSGGLLETVGLFNKDAVSGDDTAFARGNNVYSKYLGDLEHAPNPCLAPLLKAPFHAVELVPSDLGTIAGLQINTDCQVLDADGQIIKGLYAAGNDMQSIMRGRYPGPGITLGPALTFGYLVAKHARQEKQKGV